MHSKITASLLLPHFSFPFRLPLSFLSHSSFPMDTIREIAGQLNKKDWNFNDPCNNKTTIDSPHTKQYNNTIYCNCIISPRFCHVEILAFQAQELDGVLPPALVKLRHIKEVDLSRNYLSGSIPQEWASTKLERLVLSANNLSGPIPGYLGNITTLRHLVLETNLFSGTVPSEFGKLVNLEELNLNANNLTKLNIFRISGNNFTGTIPNFFGSWRQLKYLEMEASGFQGPIPSSISVLNNLVDLRITDLNGGLSEFPDLKNMTKLEKLMLRNCNISGSFPANINTLISLVHLDLSFNRLEGNISNFESLTHLQIIYLTSNFLSGDIPEWIKARDSRYQIDISYDDFSEISEPSKCRETFNFFRSSSRQRNNLVLSKCLSSCPKYQYSLHINCGGKQTTIGNIMYEGNEDLGGAAYFLHNSPNWGFSSTGNFWDKNDSATDYITNNVSLLRMNNSELYTTARLSPLSLTYYARCLENGNYTVKLHFAEIMLRDNRSYYSFGRRLFDVYVQEKLEYKDFNIEKEAKGVDKEVIKVLKAVGNFKPPDESKAKKFIVIGVVSALCMVFIILGILWWNFGDKKSREEELTGLELITGSFSLRQLRAATNNFDSANKIGEGKMPYNGELADGTVIAVKKLSSKSRQGNREFVMEIGIISGLHHLNLVKFYGCCIDGNNLLLVYEYMENNCLGRALFGTSKAGERSLKLDWAVRVKICVGIAKGLAFLHEGSALKIVHRDIKATNVLLDRDLNAKISDFGLAKLHEEDESHISTRIAGTIGYMAPEYALWGFLTEKADVYSFGVVALEIVTGKNNTSYRPQNDCVCLLDYAFVLQKRKNLLEIVDPNLGNEFNKKEAEKIIKVALLFTNASAALRPTMSEVVSFLEGEGTLVEEVISDPGIYGDDLESDVRFKSLRNYYQQIQKKNNEENKDQAEPSSSATSAHDLYQINFESITVSSKDLYPINPDSTSKSELSSLISRHSS
ncbi:hypothetical protein UlMin_018719 [Ulmus minor]